MKEYDGPAYRSQPNKRRFEGRRPRGEDRFSFEPAYHSGRPAPRTHTQQLSSKDTEANLETSYRPAYDTNTKPRLFEDNQRRAYEEREAANQDGMQMEHTDDTLPEAQISQPERDRYKPSFLKDTPRNEIRQPKPEVDSEEEKSYYIKTKRSTYHPSYQQNMAAHEQSSIGAPSRSKERILDSHDNETSLSASSRQESATSLRSDDAVPDNEGTPSEFNAPPSDLSQHHSTIRSGDAVRNLDEEATDFQVTALPKPYNETPLDKVDANVRILAQRLQKDLDDFIVMDN